MQSVEFFQTYREDGTFGPLVPRTEVHLKGLLHRSVHILLINNEDKLLVCQRSSNKDICPSHWDLSAAEHQRPGETGFETAFRGLYEELGIENACIQAALGWKRQRIDYPSLGLTDYEETMSFISRYAGPIAFADGEVTASKWIPLPELEAFVATHETTPWMQRDLRLLGWLEP